MSDTDSRMDEELMKERLKRAYRPALAPSEFKEALRKRLAQEAREQPLQRSLPDLPGWLVWVPALVGLALLLAVILLPLVTPATGTLEISVPQTNLAGQPSSGRTISALNVTITQVAAYKATEATGDSRWITILDKRQIINLLDRSVVTSMRVPAGRYTQIRVETAGGNAIVDGGDVPLVLAEELIVIQAFSVEEDTTTALTIIFDVREPGSVVDEGDTIVINPELRLEVTQKE